ncbi:hypothetical protein ASPZODRAFT_1252739 [Penicilliopsis zonata CBS 506.65]|uniref:Uncharacterized protein n=1 Tax=Penicilliopsis zonata CBS 506.65 TaxID=1073090 RepID=A0A1L9S770_9EURO|nr:hypothetical protein ASPZODRAFT_1252739 [Penicilliopsis zonata CBS 506.65]OJJ43000.1 hypothetical protein ASPZODRAFT_1252739 [Penicilliopsis zonata CBS 506.65]
MQPSGPPVAVAHPVHQPSGIAHRQRTSGPAVTNAHGPRLPNLNMGSTTSPPYHRTHAMAFDHQRNMSQHYLQTAQSQGIIIPAYSQAYPGYMQHLQHLQHQQHQQHQQQQQQTTHLSHGPPDSYHQMYMQGTGPQLGHIVTDQSTMYTQPYYHQLPYHHMQLAHGQQAMRMQVSSQPALDYRSIQNLSPSPSRSMGAGDNGKRRPLPSTHEFSAVIVDGSTPMRSARPQAQVQGELSKQTSSSQAWTLLKKR